jgi:hypothetical protein
MTSVRLPRLSRPSVFESIAPERLCSLLKPFEEFFRSKQVEVSDPKALCCQAIIGAIMQSDRDTPNSLLDAVCIIDEMATQVAVDQLLDSLSLADLRLTTDGEYSAADIMTAAWLYQREKLLKQHAHGRIKRCRAFDCFQSSQPTAPKFTMPKAEQVRTLERDLDAWFVERLQGYGTRVEIFANDTEVEMSIRHGSLFRREQTLDDGVFGSIAYRPVQCDTAIFQRSLGELRLNAKTRKEKALYCRLIGKHFFDDENCFPVGDKYTLEPLREYGHASLSPGDIDGVRSVRLVELKLEDSEVLEAITVRKAKDLFAWAEHHNKGIHKNRRMLEATFRMCVIGRKAERVITIRPPNVAIYNRGLDAPTIESWLVQRGYIVTKSSSKRQRHEPALASA